MALEDLVVVANFSSFLSTSSMISATPESKACNPEHMEAKLSEEMQKACEIGFGTDGKLWMDFLNPSLAKHQLAMEIWNFSC